MQQTKKKNNHGGARPNAGRPAAVAGLSIPVNVRITSAAKEILDKQGNKSQFINSLILNFDQS